MLGATTLAGLTGCTTKEDITPGSNEPCATLVTVRLCHGLTSICPTEHTTIELADGTRLRPSGPVWDAYKPQDGQALNVGYKRVRCNDIGQDCFDQALLSCIEEYPGWCGTLPR